MHEPLYSFVKDALSTGRSRESIKQVLGQAGWESAEIDEALGAFASVDYPLPVPRPTAYTSARESFLYLIMFMTLGISAGSVGTIAFQLINKWLPDPLAYQYDYGRAQYASELMRDATSALIIALPIFLWITSILAKTVRKNPERRLSRPKIVITYLTLFIASAFVIGALITLVNHALGGELTTRFTLKTLTVIAIAGSIFWHYLADVRSAEKQISV